MLEKLTDWQSQIVTATLIGNGYLIAPKKATNFYLSISENKDQKWLLYKAEELNCIAANSPFDETSSVWKWRSKSLPLLTEYSKRHYNGSKKTISLDVLNPLKDIALAIWFGDKGYWHSKRRIALRTSYYQLEGNESIRAYLDTCGMSCDIVETAPKRFNVVFSEHGTIQFLKTIAHRLPQFMSHRLEP